ncbi:hypothetical protein RHOSPDRAFT_31568 [Rhodotorula sp. JG-1b]|nr:hypothetical protein RHOSPDRAFT_31568 [Rhodotorula sp. JG-1b]
MTMYTKQSLKAHIDKTLKLRIEGNDKLLAGDLQGALRTYHLVLLSLRGLESPIQNFSVLAKSEEDSGGSSSEEEGGGQKEKEGGGGGGGGGGDSKGKRSAETKTASEPTEGEKVKSAILNTHLNMAKCRENSIYIKQEKWEKALRAAEAAKRLHSDHPKAVFREAQARLGLGEIYNGRKMLQNLQKKHPDSAITAALQKLELDEKARQKKADLQFRGIFAAKSKAFAAKKSEDGEKGASTSGEKSKQAAPESPAEASTSKADAATGAA